jgi:dTDP-4-amino-4,6-dideoxygalactose transaminase
MRKINFIENKNINFSNLKKIYKNSIQANHHANFGPTTKALENKIKSLLKLSKNKEVIMCSSATSGILIVAKYLLKNKKIRFATSNFTFYSSYIDDLKNTLILPSNNNCSIDLKVIKKNIHRFDNLIFTNCFNYNYDYTDIYKLCKNNKKQLIIDNSTGFYERPLSYNKMDVFEVISCHHTKPWGFGEGGIIICNKNHEKALKNLINYGVKNFKKNHMFGLNAKISDLSSAAILGRIRDINIWSKKYHFQAKRIIKILKKNFNVTKIFYKNQKTPINYIPVLFDKKIQKKFLNKSKHIVFRKYYEPISDRNLKNCKAWNTYEHILCIPSHKDLRKISQSKIIKDINSIINN